MKLKRGLLLLIPCALVCGVALAYYSLSDRDRQINRALPPEQQILLDKGPKCFLYSLQPDRLPEIDLKTMPNFHGYPILGQSPVRSTPLRTDLLAAMRAGMGKRTDSTCFDPRYGIRVVRNKKTVDLLFAFSCQQMEVHDERGVHRISIDTAVQSVFNHALAELDVPLPEKPER